MLIKLIQGKRSESYKIEKDRKTAFNILNEPCRVRNSDGQMILEVTDKLVTEDVSHTGITVCRHTETGEKAALIRFEDDSGWERFKRYRPGKDVITAGCSETDDIRIIHSLIREQHIRLDIRRRSVSDIYKSGILSVDQLIVNEYQNLHISNRIEVLNAVMIPVGEILLVNTCSNIFVQLEPLEAVETTGFIQPDAAAVPDMEQTEMLSRTFREELEEPLQIMPMRRMPLILTIGPAVTMAMASFVTSSFSIYNGMMNGRQLDEMIPLVILPVCMLLSSLFWMPMQRMYEQHVQKRQIRHRIRSYSEYLDDLSARIRRYEETYRNQAETQYPLIPGPARYRKDHFTVRLGIGTESFDIQLGQRFQLSHTDGLYQRMVELPEQLKRLDNTVIVRELSKYQCIYFHDDHETEQYLWVLLFRVLFSSAPGTLKLRILCTPEFEQKHIWIRNIPHLYEHEQRMIVTENSRIILQDSAETQSDLLYVVLNRELLQEIPSGRRMIWISGRNEVLNEHELSVKYTESMLVLEEPAHTMRIKADDIKAIDLYSLTSVLNSRYRADTSYRVLDPGFLDLFHCTEPQDLPIRENWQKHHTFEALQTPVGLDGSGNVICLNLHETGMGPHGLIAGTTGSGKSELILSILLGLSVNYSPRELQYILIDFKGGGILQSLSCGDTAIPHLAGVLTNLNENGIDRAIVSFANECRRRERLFHEAGRITGSAVSNIDDYQRLWKPQLPYLPHLVILVDEFAELRKEYPDFLKELISLARVGRSLGMHLILATQKPAGIVDEQITSNCRFTICLKVQNRQDSIEVLHSDEAYSLRAPGEFIMSCDGVSIRGKGGYAGKKIAVQEASAALISQTGAIIDSYGGEMSSVSEGAMIVRYLIQYGASLDIRPEGIWREELHELDDHETASLPYGCLGIMDDYHKGTQPPLMIKGMVPGIAVTAMEREVRISFLRAFLYMTMMTDQYEYCILDDLGTRETWISECPVMIGHASLTEQEFIERLLSMIQEKERRRTLWVIITDYAVVQEMNDTLHIRLRRIMDSCEKYNVRFVVMASGSSSFPYRDLALFRTRISLKNTNLSDLSTFFERNVRITENGNGFGLVNDQEILRFVYPLISEKQLSQRCMEFSRRFPQTVSEQLPVMPEKISLSDYAGNGIPLGISRKTCMWKDIPANETLLVIATYPDELESLYEIYKDAYPAETVMDPEPDTQGKIIFMSLDSYRETLHMSQMKTSRVLYIGEGFHDQYVISVRQKYRICEGQGIWINGAKSEVIQLAGQA
ncbi:MAG: hypothetical protein IIZ57_08585 [Solobacterium sp.]|nr:hypothetical protein [Solobacterium sp.]